MCLESTNVVSSHLMPAALYDYCRPPGGNPVSFSTKLVIESSRQLQIQLLCRHCEDILNKGGEEWILPLFAQRDGPFPFHALLTRKPPAIVDGDAQLYAAAQNPNIDTARLMHFAMGIFWKAAIHSWRGGEAGPLIDLRQHVEAIRRYLRGECRFPSGMLLMVGVLPTPVKHIAFTVPYQGSSLKWRNFLFYALGIEFTLIVGDLLSKEQRAASFSGNSLRPILLVNFEPIVQDIAIEVMKKAHKAKNVQKYLKRK
jgi:hypothetical protein